MCCYGFISQEKKNPTTTNFSFPLLSNKDKFSRHLSNKVGGEERAPSLPHRNADPFSLEAGLQLRSPAVGAEAGQGEERPATLSFPGSRACGDSGGAFGWPQPTSSRTGRGGRGGRGLPGAPTPGPQPWDQEPCPRPAARTCRPARRPSDPFAQRPPARGTHSFSRS